MCCTVALLTLRAGLTRVAMSSAGAVTHVDRHSLDQDIIRYLQDSDDYRMKVVIECFENENAWQEVLTEEDKVKYLGDWSSRFMLAGKEPPVEQVPIMLQEGLESTTVFKKIDVALLFLREIDEEGLYDVDEVIKALRLIEDTNGNRSQFPNPLSLGPAAGSETPSGRFNATQDLGPLGDGPGQKNDEATKSQSGSARFIVKAPEDLLTSDENDSDADKDIETQPPGRHIANFFQDKQPQLRFE